MSRVGERGRRPGGVSLVEFIFAVSILGMVLGIMLHLVPFSHIANRRVYNLNCAREVANSQLEYWRGYPFDNLPVGTPQAGVVSRNGTDYAYTVNIVQYASKDFLRLVNVQVHWTENGGPRQFATQTLVAKTIR